GANATPPSAPRHARSIAGRSTSRSPPDSATTGAASLDVETGSGTHDHCRASADSHSTGPTYPSARTVPPAAYPSASGTTAVRCSPSPSASTPLKVDRSVDLHEREAAPSVPKRVTPSSSPRQLRSQDSVVSASTEGAHASSTRRQAVARACPSAS